MQQGLNTAQGAPAVITPTSIATNNRYQGFADNDNGSFSASDDYDSEGTATTVESLPPVTYPRYVPAPVSTSSGEVRTPAPFEDEYGRFINEEEEMNEQKYQKGCLEAMVEKELLENKQPIGPYNEASQRNVIQVQAAMAVVLAAITANYFRGGFSYLIEPEERFKE